MARWLVEALGAAAIALGALAGCGALSNATGAGATGDGYGGANAATSSGFSAGAGMPPGTLGSACKTDADCGGMLVCVTAKDDNPVFGGGAAGGICTHSCTGDADCPGTSSTCLKSDDGKSGTCVLTCTLGPALVGLDDALSPTKCLGREDLRCAPAGPSLDVCLPTCGLNDAGCGGRTCDPRLAVCVDAPHHGDATGAKCDPLATVTSCAGSCVGFKTGDAMCSSPCVLGGVELGSRDCGGPEKGLCAFHPGDDGAGDFGFCTPSCAAQLDCQAPAFFCFAVPGLTDKLAQPVGYCFAAVPCPNGQADCVGADGNALPYTCSATPDGSFCLDTMFPYGGGAASSSATSSGSTGTSSGGAGGAGFGGAGTGGAGVGAGGAAGAGGAGYGGAGGAGGAGGTGGAASGAGGAGGAGGKP